MAKENARQIAEKKIAEALKSGATHLDLSGSQDDWFSSKYHKNNRTKDSFLHELPESIKQLTKLRSLNLAYNQLTELPPWIVELSHLEELILTHNLCRDIPESIGELTNLRRLNLCGNEITYLPDSLGRLIKLAVLDVSFNKIESLGNWVGSLKALTSLNLYQNEFISFPTDVVDLPKLSGIHLAANSQRAMDALQSVPEFIRNIKSLNSLQISCARLKSLPTWLLELPNLDSLDIDIQQFGPELSAAYAEGIDAVKSYLRAKTDAQVVLNEAKLILVGEGEVGKSCLLAALRGDIWEEGKPTTHGIEIKPVKLEDTNNQAEITLNGWDFGGQRVYRPTHQLFFTAPAVYLVVWKPREGPQQGFVKDWIKLIKHREPEAKILVVATHGGPSARQPDIDRQEIWDLFGKETVVDFFFVQSKPDEATGERQGIAELSEAIARVASKLPEMGRSFPESWHGARTTLRGLLAYDGVISRLGTLVSDEQAACQRIASLGENRLCLDAAIEALNDLLHDEDDAREVLAKARVPYLTLDKVFAICHEHKVEEQDARLLLRISRRVGDLIYFEHDSRLRDIVVLKPDWLATAMSFVLDDEQTRKVGKGLVSFERLGQLWNDPNKAPEDQYADDLHAIFLRLMERFDLCYPVNDLALAEQGRTSLIAQLVPDVRPQILPVWTDYPAAGEQEQVQICRIVEANSNQSATAEGIFYQLIVRLHKYSLGQFDYTKSIHWQRGILLKDSYGALAFLEHIANDIRISVRSPHPEIFLAALTYEVKWLVESFWEGLRCEVTVPCMHAQRVDKPCIGLFEVAKLLENKKRGRPEQPCPVCNDWQSIDQLLHNAPASRPAPLGVLLSEFVAVREEVSKVRQQLGTLQADTQYRFDALDEGARNALSRVEDGFTDLMRLLIDETKEGPRLFSFQPVQPGFFDRPKWINEKFQLTLWCEHSRLPLPELNGEGSTAGVYDLHLSREWFQQAAPFLKVITTTLSLVLPVAASATKFMIEESAYKGIENELDLGQKSLDSVLKGAEQSRNWLDRNDTPALMRDEAIRADGAVLRQLHGLLKKQDMSFGGLVRVQNKRNEFMWVHPQFESEY